MTIDEVIIPFLLGSVVMAGFIMVTAGSICVHSHGKSELCGPGGEGGGIAMVVLGIAMVVRGRFGVCPRKGGKAATDRRVNGKMKMVILETPELKMGLQ
jgi:hypothetical protein